MIDQSLTSSRITERTFAPIPLALKEEFPLSEGGARSVINSRKEIVDIFKGDDERMIVVVGPCSVHDVDETIAYLDRLSEATAHLSRLRIVVRLNGQKPRTSDGWTGFANEPDREGEGHASHGIERLRKLYLHAIQINLPVAVEMLDTQVIQYFDDLVSYAWIGARTVASPELRHLASGLSFPVGFKNGVDGGTVDAENAVRAASMPQRFRGMTQEGNPALFETAGNPDTSAVLRGGAHGPNYDIDLADLSSSLVENGGLPRVLVDCSHGNSGKDPAKQPDVARAVTERFINGDPVAGIAIESYHQTGRQDRKSGVPLQPGLSITDGCLGLEETITLLEELDQRIAEA